MGRSKKKSGPTCGVAAFLRRRPAEEARDLMRAIYNRAISSMDVWRVMRRRGFKQMPWSVKWHRLVPCTYCAVLKRELKGR